MNKQIWFRLLAFLNKHIGNSIMKKDVLRTLELDRSKQSTIGNYLYWLTKHKYLIHKDYGLYIVKRNIPMLSIYSLRWHFLVERN